MRSVLPARILVIDDDAGTIRWLSAAVQEFGEIFFATAGDAGIAMARERKPDLILLDAEMPDMDGFAVCRILKKDPSFADIPIIFVTAHTDPRIEEEALGLGAVDFITKPSSTAVVNARTRTHLALKQRTDELRRLASIDGLTGASNRRAFDVALNYEWHRALRANAHLSLALVDVDHFKRFNDHYGHQAGDLCLRSVADALMNTIHRPGEMVARYGGEEFAVILPACDAPAAAQLGERLREAVATLGISHAVSTDGTVTISVGVASLMAAWPEDGQQRDGDEVTPDRIPALLISAADLALYEAKRRGRNQVVSRNLGPMPQGALSA